MDSFITGLYELTDRCGYSTNHDGMVHDCIAVGLRDGRLAEKLQFDADLTLEKQ